jgi:hypothetical protein
MQCDNDMTLSPSDEYLQSNNLAGGEPSGGSAQAGTNNLPVVTTTITTASKCSSFDTNSWCYH